MRCHRNPRAVALEVLLRVDRGGVFLAERRLEFIADGVVCGKLRGMEVDDFRRVEGKDEETDSYNEAQSKKADAAQKYYDPFPWPCHGD